MFNNYAYLYVEDDPLSREIMQLIMQNVMQVQHLTIFEDSHDVTRRAQNLGCRPDVILLDIHIKPYDGFAMLESLRADPYFMGVRVVALTASVMSEEVEKLRKSGFDGAIAKPISVHSFPGLIQRIIGGESVWHIR